jgi:hypothetical protein
MHFKIIILYEFPGLYLFSRIVILSVDIIKKSFILKRLDYDDIYKSIKSF